MYAIICASLSELEADIDRYIYIMANEQIKYRPMILEGAYSTGAVNGSAVDGERFGARRDGEGVDRCSSTGVGEPW